MMTDEEIEALAKHFNEWTSDAAPIDMGLYRTAARAWANKQEKVN